MRVSRFTEQGKVRAPVAQELVEGNWLRGFRGIYPCRRARRSVAYLKKKNKRGQIAKECDKIIRKIISLSIFFPHAITT